MKIGRGLAVQRHFGQLFEGQSIAGLGEVQLLDRFVERRDGPAFAALVARHGPMVLGVCRRFLADPLDVEDAFQATFLVLIRRADSLRDRDRLAPWLFGVARRVATRARTDLARHRARERSGIEEVAAHSGPDDSTRELGRALVEEIDRLPASLREPILLCCVEGLTYDEAASRLRSSAPAIRGRLARARGCLKDRLTRRGFAPTVGAIGALLSAQGASAAVPSRLLLTTIQVAKAGAVPAGVDILAEGVIRTMILTKSKILGAAIVACGVAGSSIGLVAQDGPAGSQPRPASTTDRLDQVEKKLDRLIQALEAKPNRPTTAPTAEAPVPPVPPKPASPLDALDPTARAVIENLTKGGEIKDVQVSVQVLPDQPPGTPGSPLDALDSATRALVEKYTKGEGLKDGKSHVIMVQPDGQSVVLGSDSIKIRTPPTDESIEALARKVQSLEARLLKLEKRLGPEPKAERSLESQIPGVTDARRRAQQPSTTSTNDGDAPK